MAAYGLVKYHFNDLTLLQNFSSFLSAIFLLLLLLFDVAVDDCWISIN